MEAVSIDKLIAGIEGLGIFRSISRIKYMPYDIDRAIETVEKIGQLRKPTFVIDNENRFVFENLIRWVHADTQMKCINPSTREIIPGNLKAGIYIAGNTGSGKSWALEIMSAYCLIDNVIFKSGDEQIPLRWLNVRSDSICERYSADGYYDNYAKMKIIGIQDLGSEPSESLYMGNRVNVIRQLLESRGDYQDRLTLITSNIPLNHKSLAEKYGDRVVSRLEEMCNYFELKGADRRKV